MDAHRRSAGCLFAVLARPRRSSKLREPTRDRPIGPWFLGPSLRLPRYAARRIPRIGRYRDRAVRQIAGFGARVASAGRRPRNAAAWARTCLRARHTWQNVQFANGPQTRPAGDMRCRHYDDVAGSLNFGNLRRGASPPIAVLCGWGDRTPGSRQCCGNSSMPAQSSF
jgi:hypothetical protein